MPISLRLDLVGYAPDYRGSLWLHPNHLMLDLLNLEAVFVADLLVEGSRRGPVSDALGCSIRCACLAGCSRLPVFAAVRDVRLVCAARVVLRWRQVHLVLVRSPWLDHTRWLSDDLLVGHGLALTS